MRSTPSGGCCRITRMNTVLYDGWVVITPWKLLGYLGVLCFGMRWVVQMLASRREKKVTVPLVFWTFTLVGASIQLLYWTFGPKNDSVGVLQSLFPFGVAAYNLYLELTHRQRNTAPPPLTPTPPASSPGETLPPAREP